MLLRTLILILTPSKDMTLPLLHLNKDLGILYTNTLNWVEHYNLMTSRAYRQLGLLRRTFSSPNISARKKLYLSLIRSKLTYCSPIWRPSLIKHLELLETVQRRATKFILNNFELDYKSRLVHLNLLPLMLWYELADIMLLVKCIKNPDSRLKISKYITFSTTNTRSASFLKLSHYISPFKDQPLQTFLFQQSLQAMECSSPH